MPFKVAEVVRLQSDGKTPLTELSRVQLREQGYLPSIGRKHWPGHRGDHQVQFTAWEGRLQATSGGIVGDQGRVIRRFQ